jgi:hypothetical protein
LGFILTGCKTGNLTEELYLKSFGNKDKSGKEKAEDKGEQECVHR